MAESNQHIVLVYKMYEWVCSNLLYGDSGSVMVDLPEIKKASKPPMIVNDFRPDLYALQIKSNILIIGEAKTAKDFETRHSINQYKSYIYTCHLHNGKAYLVIAVPWFLVARARNLLKRIIKECTVDNTELIVIPKLLS